MRCSFFIYSYYNIDASAKKESYQEEKNYQEKAS